MLSIVLAAGCSAQAQLFAVPASFDPRIATTPQMIGASAAALPAPQVRSPSAAFAAMQTSPSLSASGAASLAIAAALVLASRPVALAIRGGRMPADPRSFNGREGADRQAPTPPDAPELGQVEEASADPPGKQVKSTLSTKHFNLAPDVRSHVDAQLEHLLQKFGSHILSLDTHLSLIKNPRAVDEKYSAELVAAVRPAYRMKTVTVRVKAKSHDMNQAIHDMTHQMERKVRHLKEKVMKVRRHSATGGISELSANNILSGSPMSYPAEYEEAVRRARDMPPMTVQDALLNFDVEDGYRDTTNVFVFINKDDLQVSVLYMDDSRKMKLFVPEERKTMDVY